MSIRATTSIPEGYEFLSGRTRDNARTAIADAVERGFPESTVLTVHDGYLVPIGDSQVVTDDEPEGTTTAPEIDDKWTVAQLDEYIDANDLDVDKSLKKSDKIDAVRAVLEAKGE